MDIALGEASKPSSGKKSSDLSAMSTMLNQVGAGRFIHEAEYLKAQSDAQARSTANSQGSGSAPTVKAAASGSTGGAGPGVPGMSASFDPIKTSAQIYVSDGCSLSQTRNFIALKLIPIAHIGISRQSC